MPFPVYIEIKHPNKIIKGTANAFGKEGLILGLSSETQMMDPQAFSELPSEKRKRLNYYIGFITIKLVTEIGPLHSIAIRLSI